VTAVAVGDERGTRRQDRLLDAVARCVARRGYHETSVDAVVAMARTSKSAFYASFPSKDAAFAALLEREGDRLLRAVAAAVNAELDAARRPGAGIATFVRACAADAATARILLLESVGSSPVVEERRRSLHARFAGLVRQQLEQVWRTDRASGARRGLDLDALSFAIIGAVNEAVVHLLERGGDPEPVIAVLEHMVAQTLLP
jgi:AcrR family transcriptional regulator